MTGMAVVLDRTSASWLSCLGSRCWISANAMPVLVGSSLRNWLKASSPPAEAPTPTTGNVVLSDGSEGLSTCGDPSRPSAGRRLAKRAGADLLRGAARGPISGSLPMTTGLHRHSLSSYSHPQGWSRRKGGFLDSDHRKGHPRSPDRAGVTWSTENRESRH